MISRGIFTTIVLKRRDLRSYFLIITFFIFIIALSIAIPRFVLAEGPPDSAADEFLVGLRPGVCRARAQAIYHAHGKLGRTKVERRQLRVHEIINSQF